MTEVLAEMLGQLKLESDDSAAPEVPCMPPEIIQHILSFLPHDDSFRTLISCQLVSRAFGAASLAASVWRPFVRAQWSREELVHPKWKCPLAEDQNVVDQLLKCPPSSKSDPIAVARVRSRIDQIAQRHLQRVVEDHKTRLVSFETITALGDLVFDAIARVDQRADEDTEARLAIQYWCSELAGALNHARAVEGWKEVSMAHLLGAEAFEVGVLGLGEFEEQWRWRSTYKELATLIEGAPPTDQGSYVEKLRREDPAAALSFLLDCLRTHLNMKGYHASSEDGQDLAHRFIKGVASQALPFEVTLLGLLDRLQGKSERPTESPAAPSQHLYLALLLALCRRLPPPMRIAVEFTDVPKVVCFSWENQPEGRFLVDVLDRNRSDSGQESSRKKTYQPVHQFDALQVFAEEVLEIARAAPVGHLQRQAKYGALLMRHFMDGDTATQLMFNLVGGEIRRWPPVVDHELQELLRQFELPEHAADLSLLERYIIPTINADATATARSIIERLKRREGEDIKPKRRSVKVDPKLRVGEIVQGYDGKVMVVTGWERCDESCSEIHFTYFAIEPPFAAVSRYDVRTIYNEDYFEFDTLPTEEETAEFLMNAHFLGRYFRTKETTFGDEGVRPKFKLSPEWKLRYPDDD